MKQMVTMEKVINGDFSTVKAKTYRGNAGGSSSGGMFSEAILFPLILVSVTAYQLYVMHNGGRPPVVVTDLMNSLSGRGAATESEMSAVMEGDDIDAEYGYVDEGDDGERLHIS